MLYIVPASHTFEYLYAKQSALMRINKWGFVLYEVVVLFENIHPKNLSPEAIKIEINC